MTLAITQKADIVKANARAANDTGSPEVQVALLTARINELTLLTLRLTGQINFTLLHLDLETAED